MDAPLKHCSKPSFREIWQIGNNSRILYQKSRLWKRSFQNMLWEKQKRGPWLAWSCSPELSDLCGIAFKSRDLNHNHLVTSIGSAMIWSSDLLFYPTWPIFRHVQNFIEANTLTKFHEYQTENLVFTAFTRFSKIWTCNLVFGLTWPILVFVVDFIKTKVLTKLHGYLTENVASRVYTRFS